MSTTKVRKNNTKYKKITYLYKIVVKLSNIFLMEIIIAIAVGKKKHEVGIAIMYGFVESRRGSLYSNFLELTRQ